jgi:hypothetical protein
MDKMTRALSLASYEDGGLESVFKAILKARRWDGALSGAFLRGILSSIANRLRL